jgi:hypothetical protein
MSRSVRLPKRLPAGTKYVVEGRTDAGGTFQVFARYVVFPNGRRIDLPKRNVSSAPRRDRFLRQNTEHGARLGV